MTSPFPNGTEPTEDIEIESCTPPQHAEGYAIIGLPAAGKSEAGEILADTLDAINIETGDLVRRGAREHFDTPTDQLSSDELGDYSTMRRETDGGDYVAQDTITELEAHDEFPERPAIVTGMRDTESPALFGEFFDTFEIVWVHANFDTRLERLQGRGRQDEADFEKGDLATRDGRESMWGTTDLAFMADAKIENEGSLEAFRERVLEVAPVMDDPTSDHPAIGDLSGDADPPPKATSAFIRMAVGCIQLARKWGVITDTFKIGSQADLTLSAAKAHIEQVAEELDE